MQGELLWFVVLCFGGFLSFYRWCRTLFASTRGVGSLSFALSSDLVFGVVSVFDHLLEFLFISFVFSFNYEWVTMCVVNALIKGEIEDQECPRTRVVAP